MTTIYFNRLLRKHVSHTSIQSNYRLNFVASLFIIAHCIAIPRLSFDDATHMIPFYAFSILGILCTFYQAVPSFIACVGCIRWYSRVAIDYNHYKSTLYALCLFIPLSSAQMTEWFSISDPILPRTVSWSASGYSSTNKMIWMLDRQYLVSYSIETDTITDYDAALPSAVSAAGRCQYFSQIGSILYVIEPNTNPSLLNTFDVDTGVYTRSFAAAAWLVPRKAWYVPYVEEHLTAVPKRHDTVGTKDFLLC
eukprot:955955_1